MLRAQPKPSGPRFSASEACTAYALLQGNWFRPSQHAGLYDNFWLLGVAMLAMVPRFS